MAMHENSHSLNLTSRVMKRAFDIVFSLIGLLLVSWIILIAWIIATAETRQNGFYTQVRVGRFGKHFKILKIKTMRSVGCFDTVVTTSQDPRIARCGRFFRWLKIDEMPQLFNVLVGQMSFVGPRPDVPGFADLLSGKDQMVLGIRPGVTGVASLEFRNEETLLANQQNPETYNRDVLFPKKVRLNCIYIKKYSLLRDVKYIIETVTGICLIKDDGRRDVKLHS